MPELSPRLQELKRQFIVPASSIKMRRLSFTYHYCPYAPCCSQCSDIFTFREALDHLRRIHDHGSEQIKQIVGRGLPNVPVREWRAKEKL